MTTRVRGGSGLGDAIYQRPVIEHLISRGHAVQAMNNWPEVFLGTGAEVLPFSRENIQVLAHYVTGKQRTDTNQWQDICASAGVDDLPFRSTWAVRNAALVEEVRRHAESRPIVLVHGGRIPMDRTDGFGAELLPQQRAFDAILSHLPACYRVAVGKVGQVYPLDCDLDLNGKTSVSDLMDLGATCAGVVGQCSLAIPLAEIFDKPLLVAWSSRGMEYGRHPYIRAITPEKVLSKPSSIFVMDDWNRERLVEAAREFREQCVPRQYLPQEAFS